MHCADSLITFITCPRAFKSIAAVAQYNAIQSWKAAAPKAPIFLMGDDDGVAEAAVELGCTHIGNIAVNEYGTPLLNSLFQLGQKASTTPVICYINTDILLPPSVLPAIKVTFEQFSNFLLIGRRWNADIPERLSIGADWGKKIEQLRNERGVLFTPDAIDYFIFPRGSFVDMPPFAIGRFAWDNWIVRSAKYNGMTIIDATETIGIVHQNHNYAHVSQALFSGNRFRSPEQEENVRLFNAQFPDTNGINGSTMASTKRLTASGFQHNYTFAKLRWYTRSLRKSLRKWRKQAIRAIAGKKG